MIRPVGAVWLRFQAELRTRWRAWVGLALIAGFAAGVVIAFAAGARRTDSAYPRYLDAQNAADVFFIITSDSREGAFRSFDTIAARPEVAESGRAGFGSDVSGLALTPLDAHFGRDINRLDVVLGRLPRRDRAEEVVVSNSMAEAKGLNIGDTISVVDPLFLEDVEPGDDSPFARLLDLRPANTVRVVGIVTAPMTFPPQAVVQCCVFHSRAFGAIEERGFALSVRLKDGVNERKFLAAMERLTDGTVSALPLAAQGFEVQRAIHTQAVALWILAGLTAVVSLLIVGQLLSRLVFFEAADFATLEALGMNRRQRIGITVVRATAVGGVAALVAGVVAVGLSPIFPSGLAGTAEPDPGLTADMAALVVGALATVFLVVALSALPAWLASRPRLHIQRDSARRPSLLLTALRRSGAPLPALEGSRFAVTRGTGTTAVPVGWSLGAISVGVGVLIATLTFAASLQHLLDEPRLYGVGWDVQLVGGKRQMAQAVARQPEVLGVAVGRTNLHGEVDGEHVGIVGLDSVQGDVLPPALEGRRPSNRTEIALGTKTMEALDVAIGDIIRVEPQDSVRPRRMTVVGSTVLPNTTDGASLDRGGLVTVAGFATLAAASAKQAASDLFVDLAPGTDIDAFVAEVCRARSGEPCAFSTLVYPPPPDIVNFGRSGELPIAMGGVFALLAAGTLVHVVVTSMRRRRRDLAVLKTLGFTRRQLVLTVASTATVSALIGLLIGVPIGLATGRWLWTMRAEDLGVFVDPQEPFASIALVTIAGVALAGALGLIVGRGAASAHTIEVLRAE